jgi:hypothetical protein
MNQKASKNNGNGNWASCDEFPFNAVLEGGDPNVCYPFGTIWVVLIDVCNSETPEHAFPDISKPYKGMLI